MNSVQFGGNILTFEGFLKTSERYADHSFIFFTKEEGFLFIIDGTSEKEKVHSELVAAIKDEILLQYSLDMPDFIIDMDSILRTVTDSIGVKFTVEVEKVRISIRNTTNTLYNVCFFYDGNLIPVSHMDTGERNSELFYGSQLMVKVATDIERFPSLVSYNIIQRQIDIETDRRLLGKKIIDLDKILAKGLHVTYLWSY